MKRTIPLHRSLFVTASMLAVLATSANNIQVGNATLTGNNPGVSAQVRFDVSWENSWRTSSAPNNWDAAWVFVKYRNASTGLWAHAQLGSDAQHVAVAGSTINTGLLTPGTAYNASTNWGAGAFVYRSTDGTGTFTANGTELRWNYGQQGITYADIAEVKVFAIEMVYLPQGAFFVGSGSNEGGSFTDGSWTSGGTIPFQITSENPLPIAQNAGALWGTSNSGNNTIGGAGTLSAAYPKGFAGFYGMKHELSQQGYVDFLNSLTRTQQGTRVATGITGTSVTNRYVMSNSSTIQLRNGIRCNATIPASPTPVAFYCDANNNGTGGEANDGQWIACNFVSWADVAAYLDWSGLRPMSELEFEKAGRGTAVPVAYEYAWGNASFTQAANITNAGSINEISSTAGANSVCGNNVNVQGPMRVGVFASVGTSRILAGAGYYGMMDLSGDLWERTVSVGHATGRAYTGLHGDGALDVTGLHNAPNWPATDAIGAGFRGGSWSNGNTFMAVSERTNAAVVISARFDSYSARGVRSAP